MTDEYPRAEVEESRQQVEGKEIEPAIVVKAVYTLDPDEIAAVEAVYGAGVLRKPTITLSKGYETQPDRRTPYGRIVGRSGAPRAGFLALGVPTGYRPSSPIDEGQVKPKKLNRW